MDPLHATIGEFAAEGYTHIESLCRRWDQASAESQWVSPSRSFQKFGIEIWRSDPSVDAKLMRAYSQIKF